MVYVSDPDKVALVRQALLAAKPAPFRTCHDPPGLAGKFDKAPFLGPVPTASPSDTQLSQLSQNEPQPQNDLCLQRDGFSLHAKRHLQAHDRQGLEKLLRYGARAPIAASRLSIDDKGLVVYELTKPWGVTRATVLRLSQSDFLRRLAMLIPPPYQNLIRHYS
jgi:hypothetical protein